MVFFSELGLSSCFAFCHMVGKDVTCCLSHDHHRASHSCLQHPILLWHSVTANVAAISGPLKLSTDSPRVLFPNFNPILLKSNRDTPQLLCHQSLQDSFLDLSSAYFTVDLLSPFTWR